MSSSLWSTSIVSSVASYWCKLIKSFCFDDLPVVTRLPTNRAIQRWLTVPLLYSPFLFAHHSSLLPSHSPSPKTRGEGLLMTMIEAPCFCVFLDFAFLPSRFLEGKSLWIKATLYLGYITSFFCKLNQFGWPRFWFSSNSLSLPQFRRAAFVAVQILVADHIVSLHLHVVCALSRPSARKEVSLIFCLLPLMNWRLKLRLLRGSVYSLRRFLILLDLRTSNDHSDHSDSF